MKFKVLLTLALLFFVGTASAMDRCMTGSWYDPSKNLHEGLNLEVTDSTVVAYFYTYRFFDKVGQNWVVFAGENGNPAIIPAYDIVSDGVEFPTVEYEVGEGTFTQVDNFTLVWSYDFKLNLDQDDPNTVTPWCLNGDCNKSFLYKRLTNPVPCTD
jgi:hypothetical protein